MMRQPSRKTNILISQFSILFISLVTTIIPEYYIYIFLLYFVIMMFIMFRTTKAWTKIPPQKELGSPIFKEKNAMKIAMLDRVLMDELKKQAMATMSLLLLTIMVLIIFPLYRATIFPLTNYFMRSIFENELLALFFSHLIMFEFIFGFMSLLRILIMSKSRVSNIMLPQNYIVYRSGIVLNDRFFIRFVNNYCIEYNVKRRYVELRDKSRGASRIRLYSDSVSELYDKIKQIGLVECNESNK